jgi:phage gp36-like protein
VRYSTIDDLVGLIPEEMLIQLTDDENTGALVAARVEEAIEQADSEIDSYCAVKYTVPFDPVPEIVKKCSVDIAIYNLYSRRVEDLPATRSERYRNAVRCLEGIAKGTISIGAAPALEPPGNRDESAANTKKAEEQAITRSKMVRF